MESTIFFIIILIVFQIIVNIKCQQQSYVPTERRLHTATLIEKKIYFLGGLSSNDKYLNDFFFLDLSKSIDATEKMPFIDLSAKALALPPPHYAAAASLYGKDSIFLFGGFVNDSFINPSLAYSFNSTQLKWNTVTFSQGQVPGREMVTNAITDNNNKIYIFCGSFISNLTVTFVYSSKMNIFDTINKVWTISESGLPGRDGHTGTFLPDTNDIIYIGGFKIIDSTTLDVYNTQSNSWRKVTTKNPPESRYGHSAVLTNDRRIVVFGGSKPTSISIPVNNRYVVLDTKTFEWYLGIGDVPTRSPFRHHTATLYNDYMFIAFGALDSNQLSSEVLIYKIGDYANFSLENSYDPYLTNPTADPTRATTSPTSPTSPTSTTSTEPTNSNNNHGVALKASLGSILGIITFGFIGFITFKLCKKTRTPEFEHVLNN